MMMTIIILLLFYSLLYYIITLYCNLVMCLSRVTISSTHIIITRISRRLPACLFTLSLLVWTCCL